MPKQVLQFIVRKSQAVSGDDGRFELVASTATVDRDGEVLDPSGCDTSLIGDNCPVVNNHDYNDIKSIVGQVERCQSRNGEVVAGIKLAVDVTENADARFAAAMIRAGYLKACSVGFEPLAVLSRASGNAYRAKCKELGLGNAQPTKIFTKWRLMELSLCVIGINPDVLVSSGVLSGIDARAIKSLTDGNDFGTASNGTQTKEKSMNRARMLERLNDVLKPEQKANEDFERARRNESESDMERAQYRLSKAVFARSYFESRSTIEQVLADPEQYFFWTAVGKYLSRGRTTDAEDALVKPLLQKAVNPGTFDGGVGGSLFSIPVSTDFQSLLLIYGAYREFLRRMASPKTKFAKITGLPDAYFITPANQGSGNPITADVSLIGSSITEAANTIATRVEISEEVMQDEKCDFTTALLMAFTQGLARRIDWAAFQGNGADDQTNGLQTGIFTHGDVAAVNSANGNTLFAQLDRNDFINVIAGVAPGALQRPCRWYISPSFLPALLKIKDGPGDTYLLRGPGRTESGEWELVDFPVTWAAQAPSTDGAGNKVAAFGESSSYLVAMRDEFELMSSNAAKWNQALRQLRAIARGRCEMRDATGFATLKLAAN